MARVHGRNARAYVSVTSGGQAQPVMFLNTWSIDFSVDNTDVTAQGDTGKVYVGGLPDATGSYAGFYDAEAPQFYSAAVDGVARKMYLYPVQGDNTRYFFGTALMDLSIEAPVDGAIAVSGDFNAASAFSFVQP